MAEHVHDYHEICEVLTTDGRRIKAWCIGYKECDSVLSENEILHRLNATERLSAMKARRMVRAPQTYRYDDELLAYAAALEGDSEEDQES